jgi:hypothetical protein
MQWHPRGAGNATPIQKPIMEVEAFHVTADEDKVPGGFKATVHYEGMFSSDEKTPEITDVKFYGLGGDHAGHGLELHLNFYEGEAAVRQLGGVWAVTLHCDGNFKIREDVDLQFHSFLAVDTHGTVHILSKDLTGGGHGESSYDPHGHINPFGKWKWHAGFAESDGMLKLHALFEYFTYPGGQEVQTTWGEDG